MRNRSKPALLAAACLCVAGAGARAALWSDTEIAYLHGTKFNDNGAFGGPKFAKDIITLQHASGHAYGSNFFFVDLARSDSKDSNYGEVYGEYYHTLSLTKVQGADWSKNFLKDVGLTTGINYGANLGDDITYSGTVSAAMEAVINNCPAFAISQEYEEHIDFALAASAAARVARNILEHGLRRGELLSVNVPAVPLEECGGFEVTRVGKRVYQDELIRRFDPRGLPYYWIGGPPPSGISVPGTDFNAVVNRRIAVTPIHLDLTGRRLLRQLRDWDWSLEREAGADEVPESSRAEEERLSDDARLDRR